MVKLMADSDISFCRHLYRKKLAQFMLREEQVEGFDEQVDGFDKKEESAEEEEEEEEDFQPSATVVPSPKPGLRSRTVRKAEAENEEEVTRLDNQPVSIFSKLCQLLMFAFKLLVFLIILAVGFLMYTTTDSSKSEVF